MKTPPTRSPFPPQPAGQLPWSWLEPRVASSTTLTGTYCSVTTTNTLAVLRPVFISRALQYGLPDVAALRLAEPRAHSQAVSAWLYKQHVGGRPAFDGVHFHSRHLGDLDLIAIYKRGTESSEDTAVSPHIADAHDEVLHLESLELQQAVDLHLPG